jgi:hypothetical protein
MPDDLEEDTAEGLSKRQKDLSDIMRLVEIHTELKGDSLPDRLFRHRNEFIGSCYV